MTSNVFHAHIKSESTWKALSAIKSFSLFLSLHNAPRFDSTGNEDLTKNHKQEPKLSFLIKAIYTMAYGLQAYHEDVCGKEFVGVCPQLQKSFNHSIFFVRKCFLALELSNDDILNTELLDECIIYNGRKRQRRVQSRWRRVSPLRHHELSVCQRSLFIR